jgi:hypothetical protein
MGFGPEEDEVGLRRRAGRVALDLSLELGLEVGVVDVDHGHDRVGLHAELVEPRARVPDPLGPTSGLRTEVEDGLAAIEADRKLAVSRVDGLDLPERDDQAEVAAEAKLVGLEERLALGGRPGEANSAACFVAHRRGC